jgi:hypothetical protein
MILPAVLLAAAITAGACPVPQEYDSCVSCHQMQPAERLSGPVDEECRGVHAGAGVGCADCHGGDRGSFEPSVAMALESRFSGAPHTVGAQAMLCGRCHDGERGVWSRSDHRATAGCAGCHGAHGVRKATSDLIGPHRCGECHPYSKVSGVKALFMQATASAMSARNAAGRLNSRGMGGYMEMHRAGQLEAIAGGIRHATNPKTITDAVRYCRDESFRINKDAKQIEAGYEYRRKARIVLIVMAIMGALVAAYYLNRWWNLKKMMER